MRRSAVLGACLTAAAALAEPYKLEPGPFKTRAAELSLEMGGGGAALPLLVRFPEGAGAPIPLIVFSHGMGGSSEAFDEVTAHWASHGYVVILPTHADSVKRQGPEGRRDFLTNPNGYRARVDPLGRLEDVKLILDSLDEIEGKVAGLKLDRGGLIDRERMGVAGHSAGALTTQMAIGVKVRSRASLRPQSVGDDRFRCAIVISGQGTPTRLLTEDSWSGITRPMLVVTGSKDFAAVGRETPESRQHPYRFAPVGDKYLLFIEGATHSSYQGKETPGRRLLDGGDPGVDIRAIGAAVKSQTLAFWDAYLKESAEAMDYLKRDAVTGINPAVRAEHK